MRSSSPVALRAQPALGVWDELVVHQLDRGEAPLLVGDQGGRGEQEAKDDPPVAPGGGPGGVLPQHLTLRRRSASPIGSSYRERPLELVRIDDHVRIRELAQLEQLGVRERRLGRSPAPDDHDLLYAAALEHLEGVVGDVGAGELLAREAEHPRDVEATLPLPMTTARSADCRSSSSSE